MADLAKRFPQNPLLRAADLAPSQAGLTVEGVLNPGAFRYQGRTGLVVRIAECPLQKAGKISVPTTDAEGMLRIVEFDLNDPKLDKRDPRVICHDGRHYLTTLSHLRVLTSADGIRFTEDPGFPRLLGKGEQETFGIEDCRVTQLGDRYYLTFTQVSPDGVGVGMRSTRDWRSFAEHGMILPPHNKDCTLFDRKVAERYYALHRPSSPELGGNHIWLAQSPDLEHWGHHRCVARTRAGMWDSARIGAGCAPIKTADGWLEIYHGASLEQRYCLGALLLDLQRPWKVLARSLEPIMEPTAEYEQHGFFGNVVFTNGQVVEDDSITMYYGASDSAVCGAYFSVREILRSLG